MTTALTVPPTVPPARTVTSAPNAKRTSIWWKEPLRSLAKLALRSLLDAESVFPTWPALSADRDTSLKIMDAVFVPKRHFSVSAAHKMEAPALNAHTRSFFIKIYVSAEQSIPSLEIQYPILIQVRITTQLITQQQTQQKRLPFPMELKLL